MNRGPATPELTRVSYSVMGLPVHLLDNYPQWLLTQLRQGVGTHVVTLNAEMVMQAEKKPDLAAVIRQAELVVPDGAGVIFYLRLRGKVAQRCPGIELSETLLRLFYQQNPDGLVFFFGGQPEVGLKAADTWQQQLSGLTIAAQHGYLSVPEEESLCQTLQDLQPAIIFVGLGVPRQELWIAEHRHLCPRAIWIGVGGSFDIWAGTKSRAPAWFCDHNLEWLYRLYQEPWRWRRMLALPHFAWKSLFN